jgi:hypothetical protein
MKTTACPKLSHEPAAPSATWTSDGESTRPPMKLGSGADRIHQLVLGVRRRLDEAGARDSTILAAEVTLVHLLPLLLGGRWKGTCQTLSEQCGRSPVSIRRSLRALERAGVVRSKALGRHGVEIHLLIEVDPEL